MMRHAGWSLGLLTAIMLASAGSAAANGYRGPDPTGATACPVNTNTTLGGGIASHPAR
jgi:hypothetical protein